MSTADDANRKMPRRGRPKSVPDEERRANILEAAMTAFIDKGFAHVTMADIARQAGMSKRDLYKLFADKRELFADSIAFRRHLIIDLPRPAEEGLPLRETLRRVFRLDLDDRSAAERDALMTLINRESLIFPELNALLYDSGILRSRELVMAWLESEMAAGRIRRADTRRLAGMMMDIVFGVLQPRRRHQGHIDRAAQGEEVLARLDILLAGLAAVA
ncbi:UNVERIFIED_ORG: TetR family transcriptional regulator [Martelella mediterranea]